MARTQASCSGCDFTWYGLKLEHCTVCHQTFTTTRNGDLHQVGPWSKRRCLTPEELNAAGKLAEIRPTVWAGVGLSGAGAGTQGDVNADTPGIWDEDWEVA